MGILNVDNIQPVGGGTTITLNSSEINVGAGITFESNGQAIYAGIITATSYRGDGSQLTGISVDSTKIETGNTKVETIDTGSNGHIKFTTEGSERIRITSNGKIGIGTDNPQQLIEVQDRSGGTLVGLSVGTQYGNAGFGGYNNYPAIMNNVGNPLIYCDTNNDRTIFFGDTVGFGTTCAFRVNGAERLRIHSNGRIEPKYPSSAGATGGIMMVGGFMARASAHHAEGICQAKTNTDVNCFDAAGWYNNSTYRYTPQVKGHYIFHGTGMMFTGMNGNSCEQSVYFVKNGSAGSGSVPQYASGYSTNYGNYDLQHISNVIYMNGTTDYLHFHLSSNTSTQIHSASSWMGWLLYPAA